MFGRRQSLPCEAACTPLERPWTCTKRAHRLKDLLSDRGRRNEGCKAVSTRCLRFTQNVRSDLYSLLQVERTASTSEIKSAYRRLARKYHPDVTSKAAASFQAIASAYAVLSDAALRQQYDTHGTAASHQRFRRHKSACERGGDVMVTVHLEFLEAALGKERLIEVAVQRTCPDCSGVGDEAGTQATLCSICSGRGHVATRFRNAPGSGAAGPALRSRCPGCGASGVVQQEWCARCGGSGRAAVRVAVRVRIPAGVDEESVLKVRGQGDAGWHGGQAGDLYISCAVMPASGMQREGLDLHSQVAVGYLDAILGGTASVATIHGAAQLPVPPGTQGGQRLTLAGAGISPEAAALAGRERGVLRLGAGPAQRGDHHFTVVLVLPVQARRS